MNPALRCGERDVERRGDVLVREAGKVAKDDRLPVLERQLRQRGEHTPALLVGLGCRLRKKVARDMGGALRFESSHVHDVALLAARARQRGVDADPVEPREDRGLAPIPVEIAPGLDEAILHGLLDVPRVVEDPQQHETESALVSSHDLGERLHIAVLRQRHELRVGLLARRHRKIVGP